MYTLEAIKANLARLIADATESDVVAADIVVPPKPDMGDLAFGCFRLAKAKQTDPATLAKEIAGKLTAGDQSVEAVGAQGPYVNFRLRTTSFADRVVREIEQAGDKYGDTLGGDGKRVLLEYANLNSHKEFHVGHLRNILYGLSLHRLLDSAGWRTEPISYLNDMGANVAKCLWLFVRRGSRSIDRPKPKATKRKKGQPVEAEVPDVTLSDDEWMHTVMQDLSLPWVKRMIDEIPSKDRSGKFLGEIYAEASKLLDENDVWKSEISLVLKKLEEHDPAWIYLWQETRRWSLLELYRYLQDFGVVIKKQYFESEFIDRSKIVVEELLRKGVAMPSQGAIIVDLDAYPDPEIQAQKLGVLMLRKTDGTLIYATKDIPLAEQKFADYPDQALSLLVVDYRQSLYFKQLFAVLKIMGHATPLKHLGFEFVTLPEGAMASRKGNVITLQDFVAQALAAAKEEVVKRHDDWNDGKIEHTAWCVAMGGIMFAMLRQDPEKVIVFDMKKALSFEGDTGPYVQYAATRLASISAKSKIKKETLMQADLTLLAHDSEKRLAMILAQLPEAAARAAAEYKPSIVAQWCLNAATAVNAFYRDVQVLDAADKEMTQARLRLALGARAALAKGLSLLGMPLPDAM